MVRIYGVYCIRIENNLIFDLLTRYAHGFLGVALFLALYWLFEDASHTVVLQLSDRYSYYIYLVHQVYILGPLSLMNFTPSAAVNISLICCCILISGVVLEKVTVQMNRVMNQWIH